VDLRAVAVVWQRLRIQTNASTLGTVTWGHSHSRSLLLTVTGFHV
jgi:hypothetical protein